MLRLPRNLHLEVHKVLGLKEICTLRFTQCCACHEICKQATCAVTKSECLEDHHHVQSAAPATKSAFGSKTAPIPCTCHQNTRFPLRLPRKVTTMFENAHGTTTRGQSRQAPAAAHQILRACAVEMHLEDFERHDCTVNSSELAAHAGAAPPIRHRC